MAKDAQIDYLTGFFLRETLAKYLEDYLYDAKANNRNFSIALIDLDHFKRYNDRFGHSTGDEILKYASSVLRLTLVGDDFTFFRYGGDEFVIIISGKHSKESARLLNKCRHNLSRRPFIINNNPFRVTMSCGIAVFPGDGNTIEQLLARADKAAYFSKRHGRNRITTAHRLKYLVLRDIILLTCGICLIPWLIFIFLNLGFFRENISPIIRHLRELKIVAIPDMDVVTLKSGRIFEGRIVEENEDTVVLRLFLNKGEGVMKFSKADVEKIRYNVKVTPKRVITYDESAAEKEPKKNLPEIIKKIIDKTKKIAGQNL